MFADSLYLQAAPFLGLRCIELPLLFTDVLGDVCFSKSGLHNGHLPTEHRGSTNERGLKSKSQLPPAFIGDGCLFVSTFQSFALFIATIRGNDEVLSVAAGACERTLICAALCGGWGDKRENSQAGSIVVIQSSMGPPIGRTGTVLRVCRHY